MFAPSATTSGSLATRQRVAQLQLQSATKHVIAVGRVVASSYCDHSGWGYKQGSIIKNWKRRYFVLKGRELIYFAERSPSGKGIDEKGRLKICSVEFTPEFTNALVARGELKNQAVKMQVDSNAESDEWFRKISEALQAAKDELMAAGGSQQGAGAGAVSMQGWLLKEGQNFKTWKRRYMTLRDRTIQYHAKPNEKPLGATRVNAVNINPSRPFALDIYSDNNRILRVTAETFAEIEAWDQAFAKALGKRACFGDPYAGQEAPFLGETFEESVLCEGWLYKRGQRSTEWQRRYFKLKGFTLQYQDGPGESVPKGAGTVVGLKLGEPGSNCVFVQFGSSRVLCVSADSQSQVDKWVQAICSVLDKDPKSLEKEVPKVTAAATTTTKASVSTSNILTRALSRAGSNASASAMSSGARSSLSGAGGYLEGYDDDTTSESDNNNSDDLTLGRYRSSTLSGSDSGTLRSSITRKCGWLRKEGARVRSLKRRYFMADGNKLYYFEQIGEAPRGHGIVKSVIPNDTYPNCLDFNLTSGRTLRVVAESPDEIRSWLEYFNTSIPGDEGIEERRSALERLSLGADGETRGSNVAESGTGWLLKKGQNFKTWKRRFFELDGKQLSYSSAPGAPALGRGVVEQVTLGNARPFCLDVRFQNGRVVQVVAAGESEMVVWNRLLQAAMLSEPIESDLDNNTQFDFDDAEEDAQLDNMRAVVTAATAFKRGLSKASSTASSTASVDVSSNQCAEELVKTSNQRAEAAAKAVAAAVAGAGRRSLRMGAVDVEEPVVCSGWLRKEGGTVKNWKRRYFTLHGPTLCYFKSDNGALLRSFTVCHVVTVRSKKLCLEITTEVGRKLLVASEMKTDLHRWLDHLHRAIAAEKRKKHGGDEPVGATPLALPVVDPERGSGSYKVLADKLDVATDDTNTEAVPWESMNSILVVGILLDEEDKNAVLIDIHLSSWEIVSVETKLLLALALPMMLSVMLEMLPDLALSMMMGHTSIDQSTQILAAYNLSNLVQMMIIGGLIMGFSSAVDTMCSHAFGAKRMEELWRITQAAIIVYLLCLPFIGLILASGKPMLVALGQNPAIAEIAGKMLLTSMLLVPFCIMYAVVKSALQAQNIVFPFVLASLVSFLISSIVAYFLAFHTSLGYIGVALGSPVGWMLKFLIMLPVVLHNQVFVETWPGWDWSEAWARVPRIGRLGVSSVLMMTFQIVGFSFISLLAGMLPNADIMIASNGIFVSIISIAFMPLLGICVAGAIRMGNALGGGLARRARLISFIVMSASLSVSGISAGIVAFIAAPYAHAFTPNVQATSNAIDLIHELLPLLPLMGFAFGLQSIFRACGKQWLCAQLNFICLFVLGVPLGLAFAIQFEAGIAGLWAGNVVGTIVFAVAGIVWLRSTSWEKMAHEAKHNSHPVEFDAESDIILAA
ncbi:hypothetical protein JM18_005499 [Phytophthora kernoviae]|uniref:PH domain-containing protein n=2 Tax=Phytophthora kernoviae TaxID=325452 RepID=A0A8T0LVW6_9STRA|nr:hypothetical protein G195_006675 [Phytophthora kernoviae 00238/432]KAG2522327.1 hypothetical protein JM16_005716 [Phytophthora kernoviae]KAG2523964.1 hypothetical protein JM18_005499 [Phytophthora kernoviae]